MELHIHNITFTVIFLNLPKRIFRKYYLLNGGPLGEREGLLSNNGYVKSLQVSLNISVLGTGQHNQELYR